MNKDQAQETEEEEQVGQVAQGNQKVGPRMGDKWASQSAEDDG